jgi:hypothetical protein
MKPRAPLPAPTTPRPPAAFFELGAALARLAAAQQDRPSSPKPESSR